MPDPPFPTHRIAILLVEGFALMSFAAVTEPLRAANLLAGRRIYDLSFFAAGPVAPALVNSSSAASVQVRDLRDANGPFDLALVVAGGDPVGFEDPVTLQWLRRQARHGGTIGGVSGGPAILANAGVMANRRMTIHWEHAAALAERHPGLLLERTLYVVDRDRLTCAGGTAPLDMMHALIAEQHGPDFARKVSDWFMHTEVRPAGGPQRAGLAQRYGTNRPAVLSAIEAMENHIADPLPLADLAGVVGVSARQLNRQFRAGLGRSAGAFYLDLRLDKSRELVRQTDLSLVDIALATGFASAAHFATAFKRRFGNSPSRHRLRPAKPV
ncbi:MAG: GlxA family transcriptional regulator [Rhodospirillaceae bacterium]|nr:GlxA family transcriptional regulator [Rhodospirillaceae bacterium]